MRMHRFPGREGTARGSCGSPWTLRAARKARLSKGTSKSALCSRKCCQDREQSAAVQLSILFCSSKLNATPPPKGCVTSKASLLPHDFLQAQEGRRSRGSVLAMQHRDAGRESTSPCRQVSEAPRPDCTVNINASM